MTRALILALMFGLISLGFLSLPLLVAELSSLVLPERETPANDLLRDVRQAPQPINPWRDK